MFGQLDRNGIGFLAAGASRTPRTEGVTGFYALQDAWQHLVTQNFPRRGITKKFRDVDQNGIKQLIDFVGMLADVFAVLGVVGQVQLKHAATEAALYGGLFVAAEIEIALFREFLQKVL